MNSLGPIFPCLSRGVPSYKQQLDTHRQCAAVRGETVSPPGSGPSVVDILPLSYNDVGMQNKFITETMVRV